MDEETSRNSEYRKPLTVGPRLLLLLMAVLLSLFACVFVWEGAEAIQKKQYVYEWRESGGFVIGPLVLFGRAAEHVENL